jgi:hypothetical protein
MKPSTAHSPKCQKKPSPRLAATSPASSTPSAIGLSSLRDAVAAGACEKRKPPNWLDRLSPQQRDEIEDIKKAWLAGELQASCLSLAISLVDNCRARGIPICGVAGVRAWLAKV